MKKTDRINEILGLTEDLTPDWEQDFHHDAIEKIFDTEVLSKLNAFEEPEYIRRYVKRQLDTIDMALKFSHKEENGKLLLIFSLPEIKRLRRLLNGLLSGSYDRSGEKPDGDDITAVYQQDEMEFSLERIAEIAKFYELRANMFLEDILSEECCNEELNLRSHPYDDPW
jgi:hypothetical protein